MPIPGKYCFGILEEDNPLKSYFRFKPLLVEEGSGYARFVESDAYPEDGCVRIVPDKNESSHFKARMRRTGRYAVVDLRNHPGENDKIRPNKNYRGDGQEQNANIIYSDVVQAPLPGSVLEVLTLDVPADSTQIALSIPLPGTKHVLVRGGDGTLHPCVWSCEPMEAIEGGVCLYRCDGIKCPEEVQEFTLPSFRGEPLRFALAAPGERLIDIPEEAREEPAPAEAPAPGEAPVPKEAPAAAPEPAAEPAAREPAAQTAAPGPVRAPEAAPALRPAQPRLPKPEPVRPSRGGRMNPTDQAMLLQTGLNPRRGRSLQEVIEDKWRHSRLDQLGHPVPGSATGQPVVSPVERAVYAVREAWAQPEARASLLSALSGIDGLLSEPAPAAKASANDEAVQALNELEAQRLKLLDDIADLKAGRIATHEKIVEEIRAGNARLFAEGEKKLEAQRTELTRLQKQVEEVCGAKAAAEEALARLTGQELERRLSEQAVTVRAASLISRLRAPDAAAIGHAQAGGALSSGELLTSVRACFERAGHSLTNDEAVNLLACIALSPVTVLSGPTGSGKTSTASLLAHALGIAGSGRCVRFTPSRKPVEDLAVYRELVECADAETPVLALIDDMNTWRGEEPCETLLTHLEQPEVNPALRLLVTAQDAPAGRPLCGRLLDRAFVIRLKGEPAGSEWAPRATNPSDPACAVSIDTLRAVFAPDPNAVPDTVQQRVQTLRAALGAYGVLLSRRTLDAMWAYCASTTKLMQRDAMAVLDLAIAQRALPSILATAPLEVLHKLPELLKDLPFSLKLLSQPLPLEI